MSKKSSKLKRTPAPERLGRRLYAGAKSGRLAMVAGTSSSDSELYASLAALRNRARALVRDVVYAKRAKTVVTNNVVGGGVGIQAQVMNTRGRLFERINTAIETAWDRWSRADSCHMGGRLHFSDLERAAIGEVFEAGECFIRLHFAKVGDSEIPLALELIESERLADDHLIKAPEGAQVTLGIEHDGYGRPLAYYVHRRHPNQLRLGPNAEPDEILRVPAEQMIHLAIIDRWPQTRGVPWLHAAIARLNQLGEYENAAVVAARIGASKVGFFENPEYPGGIADGEEADGTPSMTVEAGEFTQLPPGYKFSSWDPNYPTEAFDPFIRACLRGIAAGVGVSYESLSRDYSQSNYSSSRLALLDDRDLWRVLQQWWIRAFRDPLHRRWLQLAVLSGAIPGIDRSAYAENIAKFEAVKFKPRGWSWVDPTKEVAAYKEAERAGYISKSDIIAATGGGLDIEDVIQSRRRELDLLAESGITTDTTEPVKAPAAATPKPEPEDPDGAGEDQDDEDQPPARILALRRTYA
jgi:lambda family phage portal protein